MEHDSSMCETRGKLAKRAGVTAVVIQLVVKGYGFQRTEAAKFTRPFSNIGEFRHVALWTRFELHKRAQLPPLLNSEVVAGSRSFRPWIAVKLTSWCGANNKRGRLLRKYPVPRISAIVGLGLASPDEESNR